MLSPINDRFSGLTQIMHLTKNESHELNRAITHIATLQLQNKNNPLKLNELPQNTTDFLKIHKKIERLRSNEKLTAFEVKLLDKINATARRFEQIVLLSLSSGNARDLEEVESLYTALSTLNHDPLLEGKISPEFQKVLEALAEKMRSVADNYKDVSAVHQKLESYEENADLALESLVAQHQALEQGEAVFSFDGDLTLLNLFDQLIGFYKTYEHKESLPLYHAELISRLTQEAYTLRFNREEFRTEYQAAVEVEVLKTLRDLHDGTPPDPESEEQYEVLLLTLIEAKNKIELAKATLDSHIESLNQPEESTEKLFKEFASLHLQLEGDLEFLENQIKILSEKQTVGFFGRMKIYSRGRQVERNVRVMKEAEEDVPKGWGTKLLRAAMWGLYLAPQIGALAQFAGRTYQAIATGESPLKETADMMSNAAFARQVGELPVDEQQSLDFDVNTIQGVLNGYIPLTESIAESRPNAAEYLQSLQTGPAGVPDNQVFNPAANNSIPIPILSSEEADLHALRYMGGQVRGHYEAAGKQLAFENPFGSFSSSDQFSNFVPPEEKPQSMFTLFGQECADSIREAKTGIPLEENVHFQTLQEHAQATFGAKLPAEWFTGWLLPQEWSDVRLGSFQDWFAHSLECQVRQHICQQDIHVKSEASAGVPLLLSGAAAVNDSAKSQPVKEETSLLAPDSRQFEVIGDLADEIYPGHEIFQEPLASSASRLSSPFAIAFDVYRYVAGKVRWLWGASPTATDETLLHQLGDFFGQYTGLEGYNQIEAFKFYRDLISGLMENGGESEPLQKMSKQLDTAIQLSKCLSGDVDHFRNQLKMELEQLVTGESIFLSGGWRGDPAGHAIVYEVIKQSDNTISFRLYNTGAGSDYHVSETQHLKNKVVPYVEISNVSIDKILDRPFLRTWQLQKTEHPKDNPWEAADIYSGLMGHLRGEATTVQYGEEDLMTPQRSGTCAFMSLQALFYHLNVDKSISLEIRFQLLSAGINNYFDGNEDRLATSPQAQNLFSKALEEYSRIAADMHKNGIINDIELIKVKDKIKKFYQALDSGKQAYQKGIENSIARINLNDYPVDWGRMILIPAEDWKIIIPIPNDSIIDPYKAIPSQKAPLFYLASLKDWQPRQEAVIADLDAFIDVLKKGASEKSHLSVVLEIQTLVQKLDLIMLDFTKEESSKIISQLHTLGLLYYENIQRSCKQYPETHCQLITPKMVSTINIIVRQAAGLLNGFYPGVSTNLIFDPDSTSIMDSKYIRFMDPGIDERFRQAVKNKFRDKYFPAKFDESKSFLENSKKNNDRFFRTVGAHLFSNSIMSERKHPLDDGQFPIVSVPLIDLNSELSKYTLDGKELETPDFNRRFLDAFRFADTVELRDKDYDIKSYLHSREYYPLAFYQLYDLGAMSRGLMKLPISLTSMTSDSPLHIETKFRMRFDADYIYDEYSISSIALFHPINKIDQEYPEGTDFDSLANYHLNQISPEIQNQFLLEILNIKISDGYYISQNADLLKHPAVSISLQTFRALNGLVSGSRKLVIKETLSYFNQHAGLLVKPDYQAFFISLVLRPGILLEELDKSSGHLMARHLSDFVLKNFEFYKSLGDLKTSVFFLQLNRLFKVYVDYAEIKPAPFFLDTQGEIRTLLGQENLEAEVRWSLNKELALSYSYVKDLTDDQAQELLSAAFSVNTYFNTGYNDEKWSRLEIEDLLQKHAEVFIKLFEGPESHNILNKLAEISIGKPLEKQWEADPVYPYFKTVDGGYQIDLRACTLNVEASHGLPKEFAMHPDVLKIFNENPPKIFTKIGRNGFLVAFEGNSYRLLQYKGDIFIQREFEVQGKRVWGQYTKVNAEIEATIPPLFIKTSKLWLCETQPPSLVMTNQKNQATARADHHQIYQVDPATGKETGLILDLKERLPLSGVVARFEDNGYFAVWVEGDSLLPQQIDFPRLGPDGVTFVRQNVNGKDRMVSEAFPGYYLAEKQYVKELQDDLSYLLLENASGEQQVILAKQFFIKGEKSRQKGKEALETSKDYLDRQLDTLYLSSQSYYQYAVDSKTGKLEAPSLAARLYLGLRFLWKMRYDEAGILMRGFDTFLRPYSKEESEILTKITELADLDPLFGFSGDQDPRATAISLYAAYLLVKNARDFGVEVSPKPGFLGPYSTYLDQLNNIYGVRLSLEEELLVLNAIPKKTKGMVNRLIELDPVKGKLVQAQFSQKPVETNDEVHTGPVEINTVASADEIVKAFNTTVMRDIPSMKTKASILQRGYEFIQSVLPKELQENKFERAKISSKNLKLIVDLVKASHPTERQKKNYKIITGLEFPEKDIDWKKELASTLSLMTRTPTLKTITPFKESNTMAWILLAALEHPNEISLDAFLELNEMDSGKFKEIYEQTIIPKLLQLYPQITQGEATPFSRLEKVKRPADDLNVASSSQDISASLEYQHSIALRTPSSFTPPVVPSLKDLVSVNTTEAKSDVPVQSNLVRLEQAFSTVPVKDSIVKREMSRIAASIDLYRTETGVKEGLFSLKSLQDLNDYAKMLSGNLTHTEMTLREQELSLLHKVNRPSSDQLERAKSEVIDVGQSRQPLTVDDLIYLYWNRDAERFHEANPHLTVEEIHQLEAGIQTMLIQATHVQQLKRVLDQIELINKDPDSGELQEQLKQLKLLAEGTHAYNIDEHPEYLVMEHYANILLRPEQLKNLDLLQIRDGKIHDRQHLGTALEMIMGAGKTAVLLPLLAILNADGDTLSMGVLPVALLPSMSTMLAKTLGTGYKQMVEVVAIERDTSIDEAFLTRLQNIREGKKLMLMTDSSLQSLFLNFIEHLHNYSHAMKEQRLSLESKHKVFRDVFTLLKDHGSVVIDEVDQILNPRTEKQYTLGSAIPLPPHEIELVITLYEILETDPAIGGVLRFEFSPEAAATDEDVKAKQAFMAKTYETLKPKLIDAIIRKKFGTQDPEVIRFFENLNTGDLKLVRDYLSVQTPDSVAFALRQKPVIKDLLALAKEEIQNLLPLTCVKLLHQNYGPGEKMDYAIPYHGSDIPSLKSHFGTSHETLGYTIQMVIKEGVNSKIIAREIEMLRSEALQELKEDPSKKLEETKAHQQFVELVGGDQSITLFGSDLMLDKIAAKINGSLKLKLDFTKKYMAPQIKNYEKFISANPQLYNYILHILNAFTGTQWNADAFPERLKIVSDEIITGKTLGLLWKNRQEPVQVIKPSGANTVVHEIIAANPQSAKANALIDTAGMIRGISRLEVAGQMLTAFQKDRPDIKGVVFYDADNELMLLEKGKSDPIKFSSSELKLDERFTFYDQKHTTGSDIKQKPDATAIVTIGKNTILRDLLQSVWRLRGLDKSQKVQFTIDEEVKELIVSVLEEIGISAVEPLLLEHIMLFVAYNQAMLQGDNNFRALKHKTWEVLQQEMFKAFLDPSSDREQLAELFKSVESLFIQETPLSPWELFGEPTVLVDSDVAAKNQAEKVKGSPAFQGLPEATSKELAVKLDGLVEKTIPLLPNKIESSSAIYGREIEIETEKEQEKEVEKEVEVETETELSTQEYRRNEHFTFKPLNLSKAFEATKGLEGYTDIFDDDLKGSLNFIPVKEEIPLEEMLGGYVYECPPFGLFNQFQKPICALKIISEDEVVMVDQRDADGKGALYDLNLGLYQVEGEVPRFLGSRKFLRKVVQAKFFNGETHYTNKEIPLLRQWIKEKGAERMRKLFVDHILKFKDDSRAAFSGSILDKVLK